MLFRALVFLIFINFTSILLYSCRCSSSSSEPLCRYIYGLKIEMTDNSGIDPVPLTKNEIFAKALILHIETYEQVETCNIPSSGFGFNTAFALCKERKIQEFLDLEWFKLYTNRDFDSGHPAGSDLQNLFTIKGNDYYLMHAPADTSGAYIFTAEKKYSIYNTGRDTFFIAHTKPVKLKI